MSRHTGKHGARRSWLGSVSVLVVLALSGFLLATNLRVNRTAVVTSDTADLVEQRVAHVNRLRKDVSELSSQINTFGEIAAGTSSNTNDQVDNAGSGTLLPAIEGPGITITLDDSPLWENMVDSSGSSANINDYVVHQQDIEAVVNALWAGGAEAMMIQDQRVLSNSAMICAGNVLLLQGKKYSPPYTISAIGPIDSMQKALNDSESVRIYRQYVSAFGLGWDIDTKDNIRFPETPALLQPLRYATVKKGDSEQ